MTGIPRVLAHSSAGRMLQAAPLGHKSVLATATRAQLSAQAVVHARQGARATALQSTLAGRNPGIAQPAGSMGFVPASGNLPLKTDIARDAAKIAPWEQASPPAAPLVPRSSTLGWYGLALAQRLGLSPAQVLELLAELEDAREAEEAAALARVEAVDEGEAESGEEDSPQSQSSEPGDADEVISASEPRPTSRS